jgi:predicted amidohydrolase
MKLRIATAQFDVTPDPQTNAPRICALIDEAAREGARIVHFCEGALSGYAPSDLPDYAGYEWEALHAAARKVAARAGERGVWVVLGSAHRLAEAEGGPPPHNSVYIIDDAGQLRDRYDKRFCAGAAGTGELAIYSPGDHASVFEIDGVRCGVLICHEYRYPELYRAYKRDGVQLLFHSFHAANVAEAELEAMRAQVGAEHHALNWGSTLPEITMPASLVATAASSHMWISAANSSAEHSCWPSCFVRADGVITGRCERGRAGLLLSELDTDAPLYESTRPWRDRAMAGRLHSGELVDVARSRERDRF